MILKKLTASLISFVMLFTTITSNITVFAEDIVVTAGETVYYVGATRDNKTINAALDKIKANPPTSEENRAIINIDPGDYEEQVRIDNLKYVTIQQTPGTTGQVTLHWYFCTGYCTKNTDLTGLYDPTIDWSKDETWNGYKDTDEKFPKYTIGQNIDGVKTISYYDINGNVHKNVPRNSTLKNLGGLGWSYDKMAPLIVTASSTDIVIKDLNCVNSVPTMVTKGQKEGHLTPEEGSKVPVRDTNSLTICTEKTPETKPASVCNSDGSVNLDKYKAEIAKGTVFSAEESSFLAKSSAFNERGHAIAILGDRVIIENVRVSANQDSVWVSNGRVYFKECDLIGGTDYIYGSAAAVFDNCRLGFAGFSDKPYGSPLATPNTDASREYGYLFFNCTIYNVRKNNLANNFGGPWGASGQATYYNTTLDKSTNLVIEDKGWGRFGAETGLSRLYEYGTKNSDASTLDLSKRIKNKSIEEGGPGKGTILDEWQILEYNPRNYFSEKNLADPKNYPGDWDPMNFSKNYLEEVDNALSGMTVTIPSGESTEIPLPSAPNGISFKWESNSVNATVSSDGTKLIVTRPALGENPIESSVILYAKNNSGFGDKKVIPVTIEATTDSKNVFNIPVTVTQSATAVTDCDYTVTVSKNGALIKQDTITVPANSKRASKTISNIPANTAGIEYDVKVVSSNNDFTVTSPVDGITKISGKTGEEKALNITSIKMIDDTIDTKILFSEGDKNIRTFDLISLAKANGASSDIDNSDFITVEFDVDTSGTLKTESYIDLTSKEPPSSCNKNPDKSRFALWKLNKSWNQLDMVDCSTGFSGTSDTNGQWLNIVGKFPNTSVKSHVETTIDYKTKTISSKGSGSGDSQKHSDYTFGYFPENYTKGKLNFAIYPGGQDIFSISNLKVTYKNKVDEGVEEPDDPNKPDNPDSKTPAIENVSILDGNTIVTLKNIDSGVIVAAQYNDGKMINMKTADVTGNNVAINGIEADSVFVWDDLDSMKPLSKSYKIKKQNSFDVDFTKMTEVPIYTAEKREGFVSVSGALHAKGFERKVADTSKISISSDGAKVTESNGAYLNEKSNNNDGSTDGGNYNRGGLIYRIDTDAPGAYHLEVEVADKSNTTVSPTGMEGTVLTKGGTWDNAGLVAHTVSASWNENIWSFDFATGEDFIEIEIEPSIFPTASKPQTVGVKSIKVTPIDVNKSGDKPTIHILGDSTQKTYTFNETISSWGQNLINYFDLSKVNVINYSLGGRAMKSNYNEGRFNEILVKGKEGDFVFLHSAHNDETISTNRFSRGAGVKKDDFTANNENYNRWLDMYVEAIKARGMHPVLVTPMPRISGTTGKYNSGFNPDSPENMRKKAQSDPKVGLVELYDGAKDYIDSIDGKEVSYIYNKFEAGETPANNSANGTNGDGTHYRESASKMWCKIMLKSIYDQSVASTDTYKDKDIMRELVSYMPATVKSAVQTNDWSAVFPEMASDVSAVGVVPNAAKQAEANYYYRNNIEKILQIGALHKDSNNLFKPTQTITVGDFARGIEKVFGLAENSLSNYNKTYAELQTSGANLASVNFKDAQNSKKSPDNAKIELAADQVAITVQQNTGGTVTVYNDSKFDTAITDIPSEVTANTVIGTTNYYVLTAPSTVVKKSDDNGAGLDEGITKNAIELRNDGQKQVKYKAKADGILTVYLMFVDHKLITCENKTDNQIATKYINNTAIEGTTKANQYAGVTFDVKAGKDYEIYTNGGTGRLFGIKYESNDYPQSTTGLAADIGDTIRVVSKADTGYLNGSILINGTEKVKTMEYKFEVTGAATVSATFTKEPDFVDKTPVASDAALTREVMGAILYDAYLARYGKNEDGSWKKVEYMKQNGNVPQPGDDDYDPNIKYEGTPYIPLCGWAALKDANQLDSALYIKVKEAYNLGLMRSEQGIARGSIACGDLLEPKAKVTRAKAAKTLVFAYILTQELNGENQKVYGENQVNHAAETAEIKAPNTNVPTTVYK